MTPSQPNTESKNPEAKQRLDEVMVLLQVAREMDAFEALGVRIGEA